MELTLGFVFMFLGAVCGGSFGLPSKYVKKETPWENLWGPFFFFATILIPVTLGPVIVKDFYAAHSTARGLELMTELFAAGPGVQIGPILLPLALLMTVVFGFLWGLGSMTLGMSFSFIGLSLAYSLNYGAQIATGSMAPMLLHNADKIFWARGWVIMAGVATCLAGVVVAGRAAILRDKSLKKDAPDALEAESAVKKKPKMFIGIIIGVLSGVLCACYSIAYSYAGPVGAVAQSKVDALPIGSAFAVTVLIVWGGAFSACGYCVFLLTKNRTWGHFFKPGAALAVLLALVMAVLHDGAILFYALGAGKLGDLGGSVGYAIFMSFAIIVGNFHGFRTGEWKGASRQSVKWILAGIGILVVGVCILGKANVMSWK